MMDLLRRWCGRDEENDDRFPPRDAQQFAQRWREGRQVLEHVTAMARIRAAIGKTGGLDLRMPRIDAACLGEVDQVLAAIDCSILDRIAILAVAVEFAA